MEFIYKQLKRTSVRHYSDQKISKHDIEKIKKVINAVATSYNGQQFSAIFIQEPKLKQKVYEASGKQKHILDSSLFILFLADFNRINIANDIYVNNNNIRPKNLNLADGNINSLLYGFVDATIAAQATVDAASSLNIDSCYIGAVRNGALKFKEIFNLPDYVVPVVGLTLGYGNTFHELKPKINKVYNDVYPQTTIKQEVLEYDKITNNYYTNHRDASNNYSNNTIKAYRMWNSNIFMTSLESLWPNDWLKIKYE